MPRRTPFLWGLLVLGQVAWADEPVVLPPVEAPAPDAEGPQAPSRRDSTAVVHAVTPSEHRGEAKDTAELLALAPGVRVQDSGGLGQKKTLSLRGASPNGVLVFLDGIPLGTNVDLARLPAALVERFELLEGAAGARYGSGGLGGALSVTTRRAAAESSVFAEATVGSFSSALVQAGARGEVARGEGLVLVHGMKSAGDFSYLYDEQPALEGNPLTLASRKNNDATQGGALVKHRRALAGFDVDALAELFLEERGLAGTPAAPSPDGRLSSNRVALGLKATRAFESQGELFLAAFARRDGLWLEGGAFGDGFGQVDATVGGEVTWSKLWAERHGLFLTVQGGHEELRTDGASPARAWGSAQVVDELFFFEGDLVVAPSVRVDQTGATTGLSPKLGVSLLLPAGLELHANVGQAHRAPSFLELYVRQGHLLPNERLRPERALHADLTFGHRGPLGRLGVGGFYALYEDLIAYELYPGMLARPHNFPAAQVAGAEAFAQLERGRVAAQASYTFLVSRNLRDDPRFYLKELPYRPRHRLAAHLRAGPPWLSGRVEGTYQSAQYTNRMETDALPERLFLNAGVSSRLLKDPEVVASLELKNLLDVHSADLDGYPLPPRAAYLTLAVTYTKTKEKR